jgi:hypothetical protein
MRKLIQSLLLLVSFSFFLTPDAFGCNIDENEVSIVIVPDAYPLEISWELLDGDNNIIATGGSLGGTYCVSNAECLTFKIYDTYGDGILGDGGYWIYVNDTLNQTNNDYGSGEYLSFNCGIGSSCNDAQEITLGTHSVMESNYWCSFTPLENGTYKLTTCDLNAGCDTRVYIYEYCNMLNFDNTNIGTIYYDDNDKGCGLEAGVSANLEEGHLYFLRIALVDEGCISPMTFDLSYQGPVIGCTDPTACNFEPLATADDGSCLYPGDPDCPEGPDLVIDQPLLASSLSLGTIFSDEGNCYVNEGCLNGYGQRDILEFSTHIFNTGSQDYYIGEENGDYGAFVFDPCHGHWHYQGYAEYLLFDPEGVKIPIGFKNGFCVLDLECSGGGTAQYGCNNMGISAGCGDIYSIGLPCQWIDITDVEDGYYTMVVRTNWLQAPDRLGRIELNHFNNWGQVCINLDRSGGSLVVTQVDDCNPYTDCQGEIYGNAQPDCEGVCAGIKLYGDLDVNSVQNSVDAFTYNEDILGNNIEAQSCNDLNQDGTVTVTDAALVNICHIYNVLYQDPDSINSTPHDHCNFPKNEIINYFDTVFFTIGNLNTTLQYFDVLMKNPYNRVVGYQFKTEGLQIVNTENLYLDGTYPIDPANAFMGDQIIGLSYQDSAIAKNSDYTALCRIYYNNQPDQICLSEIIDVVNKNYENTLNVIENGCLTLTGLSEFENFYSLSVSPNPFENNTILSFNNSENEKLILEIFDFTGRLLRTYSNVSGNRINIERKELAKGAYLLKLSGMQSQKATILIQ